MWIFMLSGRTTQQDEHQNISAGASSSKLSMNVSDWSKDIQLASSNLTKYHTAFCQYVSSTL